MARAARSIVTGAARPSVCALSYAAVGLAAFIHCAEAKEPVPFVHGLVAVGRISSDTFDAGPPGHDTLGGFSAIAIGETSVRRDGEILRGTLYALPDRGFADGGTDYRPRILVFDFTLTPRKGARDTGINGLRLVNTQVIILTCELGQPFTGFDAGDADWTAYPRSSPGGLGAGRRSLDPEGLVLLPDGSFVVSEEYGPQVIAFDKTGTLRQTIFPTPSRRHASQPLVSGSTSYSPNFAGSARLTSGRRYNRGLEGLTRTPDGARLVAIFQGPLIQDGGARNSAAHVRILVWDVVRASRTHGTLIAEHVHTLAEIPVLERPRRAGISEILALSNTQFLILERDNFGPGSDSSELMRYKRINLIDVKHATNILPTGYSLPIDSPGHLALPEIGLPPEVSPAAAREFIDLLDARQLSQFGLNANSPDAYDRDTITQKWEGLALMHARDPIAPDDYFLFVCNDNDFKARRIVHNGLEVGRNDAPLDTMFLVYRITIPRALRSEP